MPCIKTMSNKEKKNIRLSFGLSILMHIIVVLLFWGMRPEELGTLKKKESDRIRSRLVRLVREKSDARKGEKKT